VQIERCTGETVIVYSNPITGFSGLSPNTQIKNFTNALAISYAHRFMMGRRLARRISKNLSGFLIANRRIEGVGPRYEPLISNYNSKDQP
jgi:hypothetical protein